MKEELPDRNEFDVVAAAEAITSGSSVDHDQSMSVIREVETRPSNIGRMVIHDAAQRFRSSQTLSRARDMLRWLGAPLVLQRDLHKSYVDIVAGEREEVLPDSDSDNHRPDVS